MYRRYKRVIGSGLRSCTDCHPETETPVVDDALNRMTNFGRLNYVSTA
jgi:hypothetical protein